MIEYLVDQGTDAWLEVRRGVLTASMFSTARDRLKKGGYSQAAHNLAMDIAREQMGGKSNRKFQTYEMKVGQEEEENAVAVYENQRFVFPSKVGFLTTKDRLFGVSPDRIIEKDGGLEVKTMVSSPTLFKHWGRGEIDEFKDQCIGGLWLLNRKWWDLCFFAYDMKDEPLKVIRIERNEGEIEKLKSDLYDFYKLINQYKKELKPDAPDFVNGYAFDEEIQFKEWKQ